MNIYKAVFTLLIQQKAQKNRTMSESRKLTQNQGSRWKWQTEKQMFHFTKEIKEWHWTGKILAPLALITVYV